MERELAKLKNSLQTSDLIKRKENEEKRELNISSQDTLIVNRDQSTDQSGGGSIAQFYSVDNCFEAVF